MIRKALATYWPIGAVLSHPILLTALAQAHRNIGQPILSSASPKLSRRLKERMGALLRPTIFESAAMCWSSMVILVAAGKAANLVGERPMPSIARFGRLAYPMRGEVTNRAVLGRKSHGRPGPVEASGGNDLGGKQTRRLEDKRMTAAAKAYPARSRWRTTVGKPTR
jgi:hypothetical protein